MSCTRSSPNWPSRKRDTASYSYSPCCALVVDLTCHSISGRPSAPATSCASTVLPVPGSPFTNNGRSSVTAAFTATSRSREAMYFSVLLNPATQCSFACRGLVGRIELRRNPLDWRQRRQAADHVGRLLGDHH